MPLELPDTVLVRILQRCTLQELAACALACQSWAWAAAACSTEVIANVRTRQQKLSLQAWLRRRGNFAASLKLLCIGTSPRQLTLPCSQLSALTSVDLEGFDVHIIQAVSSGAAVQPTHVQQGGDIGTSNHQSPPISAAAPSAGLNHKPPSLRVLKLARCSLTPAALSWLTAAAAHITELSLVEPTFSQDSTTSGSSGWQELVETTASLLQQLPSLQHLQVSIDGLPLQALAAISTMQHLQHLNVSVGQLSTCAELLIPHSITGLVLGERLGFRYGLDSSQQRELCSLDVGAAQVCPAVLLQCTALQRLTLRALNLASNSYSWPSLLQAAGRLPQLQHLGLPGARFYNIRQPSKLALLTAATQLTALHLPCTGMTHSNESFLSFMLPTGTLLPQLQVVSSLHLRTGHDTQLVVKACPALRHLDLMHAPHELEAICMLSQLQPGLTHLSIPLGNDLGLVTDVARLTSLQSLRVTAHGLSHVLIGCLEDLTQLQQLTCLQLYAGCFSGRLEVNATVDSSEAACEQGPTALLFSGCSRRSWRSTCG